MNFRRSLIPVVVLAALAAGGSATPESLIDQGHFKRARTIVEPRVQQNPNDAEAAYLLSQIKLAYSDLDAALKLAQKAVALDGKNGHYHYQLGQVYGEMAERASIFRQLGLAHKFRDETLVAIQLDPNYVDAREGLMEFYIQAPGIAGGDKNKARAMADEIAKINAVEGYLAQARLAQEAKDTAKQEAALLKAVEAGPRNYEAHVTLGSFYAGKLKKYDSAEKYLRAAQQIDPGRSGAYAALAQAHAAQQRWNDLDALLAQAEKNAPDDFNPYYQAGKTILLQGGDYARAERYFRKYLTQEPEGDQPDLASGHWRLGLVLEKEGRKSEAIAELQTAVQMKPDFKEAKKDLGRLK